MHMVPTECTSVTSASLLFLLMSFYNPQVRKFSIRTYKERKSPPSALSLQDNLKIKDIEAAAVVSFDLISDTVDRNVFGKSDIDRSRLIDAVIDMLYKYYME